MSYGDGSPVRVELVCAGLEPPVCTRAALMSVTARRCALETEVEIPPLEPDTGVVVRLEARRAMEIVGLVERHVGRTIDVHVTRVSHREKRYFPREFGGIDLRWKRVEGESPAVLAAWRRGLSAVDEDAWHIPNPFMNFSASGLRFRDVATIDPGDVILVEFRVQGATVWHRATAVVIRYTPNIDGHLAEAAIAFRDIDPKSVEALADYTLDRQLSELARLGADVD